MAVITGFLAPAYERRGGYATDPHITGDLREYSAPLYPPVGQIAGQINAPALVGQYPVSTSPRSIGGFKAQTYLDDFYYRVHLMPPSLALGNVITDRTVNVTVWNAHFSARTISAINVSDDAGIVVDGPSYPYTMQPLRELVLPVDISRSGSAQINAAIEFVFTTSEDTRETGVSGTRITAWTFSPDWSRPLVERLEWLTDVLTSYSGTEQRISIRQLPRRSFEFDYCAATAKSRRLLDTMLYGCGAQAWAVPIWTDGSRLSAALPVGALTVPADTAQTDYHVGGLAIIMISEDAYEVVEVAAVGVGSITLIEPTARAWSAGARVYPVRIGLLDNAAKVARFTGEAAYGVVRFRLTDDSTATAASETTYRSYPVLTQAPVWSRDLTTEYKRKLEALDFGVGGFTHNDEAGIPFQVQAHHWTLTSRSEVDAFRRFLYARRGKARALWVPTFLPDLQLIDDVVIGDSFIDVEYCGYALYVSQAENRRDIRIRLRNGTIYYRRILASLEVSSSVERLTIDSALPASFSVADVDVISFLSFCRLDSDTAEISWWTDTVADSTLNFRSVRNGV